MIRAEQRQIDVAMQTVELSEEAVLAKAVGDLAVRVRDAMRTMTRLPMPADVRGMQKTTAAIYAAMGQTMDDERRRRPASAEAIDRAEVICEALFRINDVEARRLLVVRGLGYKWDAIIVELNMGCSVRTAQRRHDDALVKLLIALHARAAEIA